MGPGDRCLIFFSVLFFRIYYSENTANARIKKYVKILIIAHGMNDNKSLFQTCLIADIAHIELGMNMNRS